MLNGARDALPRVQALTPVNNGFMKQGWQINFRRTPRRVLIVNVGDAAKTAAMEEGRRGKFEGAKAPPFAAILNWVANKLRPPKDDLRRVARAVWRKIWFFGIKVPLKTTGKGAMLARTVAFLGADFFGRKVTDEIARLR